MNDLQSIIKYYNAGNFNKKSNLQIMNFFMSYFIDDYFTAQEVMIHFTKLSPSKINPIIIKWKKLLFKSRVKK